MRIRIRNDHFVPELHNEGKFRCPLPAPHRAEGKPWDYYLNPNDRLYFHQTLSSVRACRRYLPNPRIPCDSLDFQLMSRYNHARQTFPEKVDQLLQRETWGGPMKRNVETFRLLRNTRSIQVQEELAFGHPLRIGGIKERISPHSIKLINSGPHNQVVNNGYSRQTADGNFFRY